MRRVQAVSSSLLLCGWTTAHVQRARHAMTLQAKATMTKLNNLGSGQGQGGGGPRFVPGSVGSLTRSASIPTRTGLKLCSKPTAKRVLDYSCTVIGTTV